MVGDLTFREALTEICERLARRVPTTLIQDVRSQRAREKEAAFSSIDDEVAATVAALASREVRLGVVSNGFEEDARPWAASPIAPAFRSPTFSCERHVAKPDLAIYSDALERLGVPPQAAIDVGDGADNELEGARRAGLRAFRATWFVWNPVGPGSDSVLTACRDVLDLVAAH